MMDHRLLQLHNELDLMYVSFLGSIYVREINLVLFYTTLFLTQYADLRDFSLMAVLLLRFFSMTGCPASRLSPGLFRAGFYIGTSKRKLVFSGHVQHFA